MALSSSCSYSIGFGGISCPRVNPRKACHCLRHGQLGLAFSAELEESQRPSSLRISVDSTQRAQFVAWQKEFVTARQLQRPLSNVRMDFLVLGFGCCRWRLRHGSPPVVGQCLVSSHSPLRVAFYN